MYFISCKLFEIEKTFIYSFISADRHSVNIDYYNHYYYLYIFTYYHLYFILI